MCRVDSNEHHVGTSQRRVALGHKSYAHTHFADIVTSDGLQGKMTHICTLMYCRFFLCANVIAYHVCVKVDR